MCLILFQPDIPQNTGTLLRLAACFGLPVDLIEPCGFVFGGPHMRRAGMDYLDQVDLTRHMSWTTYQSLPHAGRLIVLSTKGETLLTEARFMPEDRLLLGRESAGVPPEVAEAAGCRVRIPLRPNARSLNVAIAGAIAVSEALRQTDGFSQLGCS